MAQFELQLTQIHWKDTYPMTWHGKVRTEWRKPSAVPLSLGSGFSRETPPLGCFLSQDNNNNSNNADKHSGKSIDTLWTFPLVRAQTWQVCRCLVIFLKFFFGILFVKNFKNYTYILSLCTPWYWSIRLNTNKIHIFCHEMQKMTMNTHAALDLLDMFTKCYST